MSRIRLASILVLAIGVLALVAGGALVSLRIHHTIGEVSVAAGLVFSLAGAAGLLLERRTKSQTSATAVTSRLRAPLHLQGKRARAAIVAAIIVGATVGTFLYAEYSLSSQSGSQFAIALDVTSATEVTYPDGSVGVTVQVAAVGGIPPYNYTALWGDRANQSSADGNFTRVFGTSTTMTTDLTIMAKSSNHGQGYLLLTLPSQPLAVGGQETTRTLNVASTTTTASSVSGGAVSSGITATKTLVALTNASIPTISSTSASSVSSSTTTTSTVAASSTSGSVSTTSVTSTSGSSTTTSGSGPAEGYQVVFTVKGQNSGQPIAGAIVALRGGISESTAADGTAYFYGVSQGVHFFTVTYGKFSTTIIAQIVSAGPSISYQVEVPGQ